jgi:predicted DCC family thiol-disulfide oxidoreductase YuxK
MRSNTLSPAVGPFVVFYDASCEFCRRARRLVEHLVTRVPLRFVDGNDPAAMRDWPMIDPAAARESVLVLDPLGRVSSGFDAFVTLMAAASPSIALIQPLLRRPPFSTLGEALYHWIAGHRGTISARLMSSSGHP